MSHPYSFQRQFGQELSKPINTSEFFLTMMKDLSFLYTLFQERDVLRSSERIRQDHLGVFRGLWFVIKFLDVVCAATIDWTFWSKWRWFSLDCNAKGLYQIALPSIFQGQTGLPYTDARHQKLATRAWDWFLRSNRRLRDCQWVSRKSLGALSHN